MSRIIAIVAVALLVLAGASAFDASLRASAESATTVVNESFVTDGGNLTRLDQCCRPQASYNASVDVYAEQNTSLPAGDRVLVAADGNYSWYRTNGTLRTVANSYLDNRSNATVTYGYLTVDATAQDVAATLGYSLSVAQWAVLVLVVGLVVTGLAVLART